MLQKFKKDFQVEIGLSDHTMGSIVPIVAAALGAKVIEKHFILDKKIGGPDASFSMDESEFKAMVEAVRQAESAVGEETYTLTEKQKAGKAFSRSLYIAEDVKAGDLITKENVRSVRPGFGMHPKFLSEILGKKFKNAYSKGTALTREYISS
jgi:pseudaminic acid synthase